MASCDGDNSEFFPKPQGFNYITLPPHEFVVLKDSTTPYVFEYSKYANITADTIGVTEPHWKKIFYPRWGSEIDITYKSLNKNPERLDSLIRDVHKLVSKHYAKMEEQPKVVDSTFQNGNVARLFYLSGEVPTTFQFYTTDSIANFMRCSLYFPSAHENDSLKPIIDFCIEDMYHMINTLEWRDMNNPK